MHWKSEKNLSSGLERRVNIKQTDEANKKFHLKARGKAQKLVNVGFSLWQEDGNLKVKVLKGSRS